MGPEKEVRIQNLSLTDSKPPELITVEHVPSVPSQGLAPGLRRRTGGEQKRPAEGEGCLSLPDF